MALQWNDIRHDPYLAELRDLCGAGLIGRVIARHGPSLEVVHPGGMVQAQPAGKLARAAADGRSQLPVVGDYVELDASKPGTIVAVLPRRTMFERKEAGRRSVAQVICANIDSAVIVTTMPPHTAQRDADRSLLRDFSVRRVERFVATLDSRIRPIVVLNKSDLVSEADRAREAVCAQLPGIDVLTVSAAWGDGIEDLRARIPVESTAVLVGSSGCGKSTLIARLTGDSPATASVREADGRGRHTTTARQTYAVRDGGLIIDTPGVREVQLASDVESPARLGTAFPEIDALADTCRFSDCRHESEPGCAVREAVRSGLIGNDRYLAYLELHGEQDVAAARLAKRDRLIERRAARASRMRRRSRGG